MRIQSIYSKGSLELPGFTAERAAFSTKPLPVDNP